MQQLIRGLLRARPELRLGSRGGVREVLEHPALLHVSNKETAIVVTIGPVVIIARRRSHLPPSPSPLLFPLALGAFHPQNTHLNAIMDVYQNLCHFVSMGCLSHA